MDPESKVARADRDGTDESLRVERDNADHGMMARRTGLEENADEVVERARDKADAVLDVARGKADDSAELGDRAQAVLTRERAREDHVLEGERAAADELLRREREQQMRTLAVLLPLEREATDRHLLTERARSDDLIAHRDDFLGMVSHDLRSLLCGITLEASVLSEGASDSDEGRRTIAAMKSLQRYAARMNSLIGDLIDVASIDAGKLGVRCTRCDAVALVAETVAAFEATAAAKSVALTSETAEAVLFGDFDRDRMLQVLANLVSNALKFTPPRGAVVVAAAVAGDEIRFSVTDTGIGIPSGMLDAVFERFWQVGENDRRGFGLGLYISKCIVAAHGGKIWVDSTLGAGSSFHVTIPRGVPSAGPGVHVLTR